MDISEFPKGYAGRRRYVKVCGVPGLVACCYTYYGSDGRSYLHPDFGGDLAGVPARSDTITMPYVVRDIGEYKSPIDGVMITSRSMHRDHLKAHDVVEVGNERMPAAPSAQKTDTRPIGEAIKRRIEEVQSLPQTEYDTHVKVQQAEHAEVAALVTATV